MYSLSISFGPNGLVWAFLFKDKNKAELAYELISNPSIQNLIIEDDFGQKACFKAEAIHSFLVEDLDQIEEARIQRSLADERCKAKFMQRAKSDPTIRQAMGQGPGIVSPFPR